MDSAIAFTIFTTKGIGDDGMFVLQPDSADRQAATLSTIFPRLVLHDFDKSGFSISGTLTRDTRRYTFATAPQVIDLGLRLEDIRKWNLTAEDVINDSDPD